MMPSDTQLWLEWLPTAPSTDRPALLFGHYHAKLLQDGVSEADADEQLVAIQRLMRTSTDGWQAMFNNIYASPTPGFSTDPNTLLVSAVEGRTPGRALDVSTGQGRNAVFLATQGWDVTAVDISDEGLKLAARNAERAGVQIRTVLQSIDAFDFGTALWDLMVVTYVPVPLTSPAYVTWISDSLRPAGLLVVESCASDASAQARRPVDIDPADLQHAFADFRILHFADTVAMPDWDKQATRLVRFIAEKQRGPTLASLAD